MECNTNVQVFVSPVLQSSGDRGQYLEQRLEDAKLKAGILDIFRTWIQNNFNLILIEFWVRIYRIAYLQALD